MYNIFVSRFFKRAIAPLWGCLLSSVLFSSIHAVTVTNALEMGSALFSIPVRAQAHHLHLRGKKREALMTHIAADTTSLLNKLLFFYNNVHEHGSMQLERDTAVNGAVMASQLTELYRHIKDYRQLTDDVQAWELSDVTDNDDHVVVNDQDSDRDMQVNIAHAGRILTLPLLQGVSAFALALTQEEGKFVHRQQLRLVMTAAHALTYLMEAYTNAPAGSSYKKIIGATILVNAAWLAKELKDSVDGSVLSDSRNDVGAGATATGAKDVYVVSATGQKYSEGFYNSLRLVLKESNVHIVEKDDDVPEDANIIYLFRDSTRFEFDFMPEKFIKLNNRAKRKIIPVQVHANQNDTLYRPRNVGGENINIAHLYIGGIGTDNSINTSLSADQIKRLKTFK